jgi:thiol-disulfide isomerase/thioredoxin
MRRRELLAAVAGVGAAANAGCTGAFTGGDAAEREPITVETLDAPGSEAGTATVPAADRVTFVEFFATTCSVCAAQMDSLRTAAGRVDEGVQFLSVTSEPVGLTIERAAVVDWWREHGGTWPVAVDDGTALSRRYGATSVPKAVVVSPDGTVVWKHAGRVGADAVEAAIRRAREKR